MRLEILRSASVIRLNSWISSLSLIPLLMSLPGCPKTLPPDPLPASAVCRDWNREQLTGYFVLVQLAKQEKAMGDDAHVAAAVEATGALLVRCGILKKDKNAKTDK